MCRHDATNLRRAVRPLLPPMTTKLSLAMSYFAQLGESIEARWQEHDYRDAALPAIAEQELLRTPPHESVSPWDLAQLGRKPQRMPEQGSPGFGQPPLAVWGSGRMYIEVLYWLQATTAIHQHSFSGAFAVLEGSSLHTQYTFRATHELSDYLHLGKLAWTSSELLTRGAVRQIHSGPAYIHALFHLDHPSVSVVVRNYQDEDAPPQLGYFPPGLGTEESAVDPRVHRSLELYRMLVDIGRPKDAAKLLGGLAGDADLMTVYVAMAAIGNNDTERAIASRVRTQAHKRHGAVIDTLALAIELEKEAARITELRSQVTDPNLRYLLALLLVVPTDTALATLIAERYLGRDLALSMLVAIKELARLGAFSTSVGDDHLRIVEYMLQGKPVAEIVRAYPPADRIQARQRHADIKALPMLARLITAALAIKLG